MFVEVIITDIHQEQSLAEELDKYTQLEEVLPWGYNVSPVDLVVQALPTLVTHQLS